MPDMRKEFEAWYSDEYYEGDRQCAEQWLARDPASDRYLYGHPVETWRIWQASRAALKVELPDGDPGEVGPRKFVIEEVKEALQQAGIEVK